jgi:hypothetical protein
MIRSDLIHAFSQKLAIVLRGSDLYRVAMYDYYTIIARAVSRLERNTPAARQALFKRVRIIHMDQLCVRHPPPSNSEIERRRMGLEDAIRKIELESMFDGRPSQEPACVPSTKRLADDHKLVRLKQTKQPISVGALREVKPPTECDHPLVNRQRPVIENSQPILTAPQKGRSQSFFEPARGVLIEHLPRGREDAPGRPVGAHAAIEVTPKQVIPASEPNSGGIAGIIRQGANNLATETTTLTGKACAESGAFEGQNSWKPSRFISMQLLDQLLADAADPFALDTLKQDARSMLKWLQVERADAIKLKDYDRVARAFEQYISEGERSNFSTRDPRHNLLTDDIEGVFSRWLEREQGAAVFEKVLSGVANIWVGVVVGLNFLGVVGLLIAEPTLWAGIAKMAEIYSPLNVWTWAVQVLAVLPSLLAFAWLWAIRDDRLRRL